MGTIHVDVTISNMADRSRRWTGRFLVDTGATDTVIPRNQLDAIGITPERQRVYELADGRQAAMDIAGARIEFMGEFTAGLVVFGAPNSEPLLGVTVLESVGVEVDPRNERLTKLSAVRLKGVARADRLDAYRSLLSLLADLEPIDFPVGSNRIRALASQKGADDVAGLGEDYISLYCQHLDEKGYVHIRAVQRSLSGAPPSVMISHVTSVGYDMAELSDQRWPKIKAHLSGILPLARDFASIAGQLT